MFCSCRWFLLGERSAPCEVIPQLENIKVRLTGARVAATSYSELLVTFTPVSPADHLLLQVRRLCEWTYFNDFSRVHVSCPH